MYAWRHFFPRLNLSVPMSDRKSRGPHAPALTFCSLLICFTCLDCANLSQLYFAVYRSIIHVTVPQGLKQTLPGTPDIKLVLPQSEEGVKAGGYIDPSKPHSVNHMSKTNVGIPVLL